MSSDHNPCTSFHLPSQRKEIILEKDKIEREKSINRKRRVSYTGLKKQLHSSNLLQSSPLSSSLNYLSFSSQKLDPISLLSKTQKSMIGPSLDTTKPAATTTTTIKLLCSYGGKIAPRYPDGKLRYYGGDTRVLAVDRSVSFSELLLKLGELCGSSVTLRCQLPTEDLDALVSITSDEDLANLIEEYDQAVTPKGSLKIRAFLSSPKKVSPPSTLPPLSPVRFSHTSSSSSSSSSSNGQSGLVPATSTPRCHRQISRPPVAYPVKRVPRYGYHVHGNPAHVYLVHNGNHWQ